MMKCKTILFAMVILLNINFIESQSVVIKNATIYDGISDEPFVGNILFEDGIIKKVSSTLVQGDISIDATGKIVTPGFIAADTEIGIVEIGALSTTRDDGSDIYKIGFSIHDAFNPNSTLVPWNRANGITSAITLPRKQLLPQLWHRHYSTVNISTCMCVMQHPSRTCTLAHSITCVIYLSAEVQINYLGKIYTWESVTLA